MTSVRTVSCQLKYNHPVMPCRLCVLLIVTLCLALLSGRPRDRRAQELVLGSWSPPRNLDVDYFQFLVDLGFNHTLYWRSPEIHTEQWRRDLDRAAQSGLKLVFDSWQPAAIPETWLEEVLKTACAHPAFGGVYAPDEPGYRFPFESAARKPSLERFQAASEKMRSCAGSVLFLVDGVPSSELEEGWVGQFVPYCTVFGLDIYPYGPTAQWRQYVQRATREAARLAAGRPIWMVLQGHGRADWHDYASENLGMNVFPENGPRPPASALLDMASIALVAGADGIWWWSFELYDWQDLQHREFIHQFREVHRRLRVRFERVRR